MEAAELGLRERKKQMTRERIASCARALFIERGFDAVPVAEIARAADVSEQTVFNYFPTKEDLIYSRLEGFEERLLAAVRERPAGESVLDAFARFILEPPGPLALDTDPEATERIRALTRVITASPALLARERQVFDRYAETLAELIAEETGAAEGDLRPRVAAQAILGVHRSLIDRVRALSDELEGPELAKLVKREGRRSVKLLAEGLGDYGTR
jgi:AcrR family transcriptional regulator